MLAKVLATVFLLLISWASGVGLFIFLKPPKEVLWNDALTHVMALFSMWVLVGWILLSLGKKVWRKEE